MKNIIAEKLTFFLSCIFFHNNLKELKLFCINENILFPIYITENKKTYNGFSLDKADFPMIVLCDENNEILSATSVFVDPKLIKKYKDWIKQKITE